MLKTKQHGITAAGLSQLVGLSVMWSPHDGIKFNCKITDVRTAFGRIDVELQPMEGEGLHWVSAARVRGITDDSQKMLAKVL